MIAAQQPINQHARRVAAAVPVGGGAPRGASAATAAAVVDPPRWAGCSSIRSMAICCPVPPADTVDCFDPDGWGRGGGVAAGQGHRD